jgi:hypothetical protein
VEAMKTWIGCILLAVSTFVGAALFSALRVVLYKTLSEQPNMAPEMFIVFSPVLAAPIVFVVVIVHALFAKKFEFKGTWQWIGSGLAYSTLLLGLISPWLLIVPLAINPITILLVRRATRGKPND